MSETDIRRCESCRTDLQILEERSCTNRTESIVGEALLSGHSALHSTMLRANGIDCFCKGMKADFSVHIYRFGSDIAFTYLVLPCERETYTLAVIAT